MTELALYLPQRSRFVPEIADYHVIPGLDGRPVLRARFVLGTRCGQRYEYDFPAADLQIAAR